MVHYAAFISRGRECIAGSLRLASRVGVVALFVAALAPPPPPIRTRSCASSFPTGETGFDPVRVSDLYSTTVNEAIFERLLTYDYLARPAKLVPMVAEAMPEVTDDGRPTRSS